MSGHRAKQPTFCVCPVSAYKRSSRRRGLECDISSQRTRVGTSIPTLVTSVSMAMSALAKGHDCSEVWYCDNTTVAATLKNEPSITWSQAWWRHQMEIFTALLAICAGRPVTRSFDIFFDLRLNKQLSKQSWGWWFEMLSRPLWRHRNGTLSRHPRLYQSDPGSKDSHVLWKYDSDSYIFSVHF